MSRSELRDYVTTQAIQNFNLLTDGDKNVKFGSIFNFKKIQKILIQEMLAPTFKIVLLLISCILEDYWAALLHSRQVGTADCLCLM